jgi:hypothetical protein
MLYQQEDSMTQFFDYSKTNPFSLLEFSHIQFVADALRHYHKTVDRDPVMLALAEYADEELERQQAMEDPPEFVLCAKIAEHLGVHPADGATTFDEYWAKKNRDD